MNRFKFASIVSPMYVATPPKSTPAMISSSLMPTMFIYIVQAIIFTANFALARS